MSFKLFTISTMYPGYLESFYKRFHESIRLPYNEHYNLLLNDTTEFVGSYTKSFRKLGIDAKCVIANDDILQRKWRLENCDKSVNDRNVLLEQVKKFQPEILWIEDLSYTDKNWLTDIRNIVKSIRLIVAYHCSPYSSKILERFKCVDFVITCTPGLKIELESKGLRSYLVYHAFDRDILNRIGDLKYLVQNSFIFSGSLNTGGVSHGDRIALIESLLRENIDIALYVNLEKKYKIKAKQSIQFIAGIIKKLKLTELAQWYPILDIDTKPINDYSDILLKNKLKPVFGLDMYKLFLGSKIVLNFHIGVAGNYAGNMRLFEVTGVGSCLLTDDKKNINELFDVNSEIVVYNSVDDCIMKAKWLLEHEEERKKIACQGQQRTLKCHTVDDRCQLIIEILETELKKMKYFNKIVTNE